MQTHVCIYIYTHIKSYMKAHTHILAWGFFGHWWEHARKINSNLSTIASIPVCVEIRYFPIFDHSLAFFTPNIALELRGGWLYSIFLEWVRCLTKRGVVSFCQQFDVWPIREGSGSPHGQGGCSRNVMDGRAIVRRVMLPCWACYVVG